MKKIEAVIKPFKLDEVKDALNARDSEDKKVIQNSIAEQSTLLTSCPK
jgi:nitrogen regulatory protein PII